MNPRSRSKSPDYDQWDADNAKYMEPKDFRPWCSAAFDAGVRFALSKVRRKSYALFFKARQVTLSADAQHLWDVAFDLSELSRKRAPLSVRTAKEVPLLKKEGWRVIELNVIRSSTLDSLLEKHQ